MINKSLNVNSSLEYSIPVAYEFVVLKHIIDSGVHRQSSVVEIVDNAHLDDIRSSDLSIMSLQSIGNLDSQKNVIMHKNHDMSAADLAQDAFSQFFKNDKL